jgi:hypothetical protein
MVGGNMIECFIQNPAYLVIALFVWFGLGLIIEGAIAEKYTDEILIWFPKVFYDAVKMNWFGSWFCFILLIVVNPFGFFLKLCVYLMICICYAAELIKWLFTVGRKDD